MNRTSVNMGPEKVFFLYEEGKDTAVREEAAQAVRHLIRGGIRSESMPADRFLTDPGGAGLPGNSDYALFVTDSPVVWQYLQSKGLCAAGWIHERSGSASGTGTGNFAGAAYLLEEPGSIDADSYVKIYQRLKGLPWTILETERCMVRELEEADAEAVLALYDAEALRFVESPAPDADEERRILAAYREKVYGFFGYGTWAVMDRETGRLIGRAGYEPFERENGAMSFGYIFHPDFRNRGYAQEVCGALVEYGFTMLGFTAVEADTDPDNTASVKLLERLGFALCGSRDDTDTEGKDAGKVLTFRRETVFGRTASADFA